MTDALYYQLETTLESSGSSISPSEAQGALCGMLCLAPQLDVNAWMDFILDQSQTETQSTYRTSLDADLAEVQEITETGFDQDSGGMTMLLPLDDAPLEERLEALSRWCEGFLYGVGVSDGAGSLSDRSRSKATPESAEEFITDIREISRLDTESDDDDAEHYYMELVEYIRVGVLVFREEMLPPLTSTKAAPGNETEH